MVLKRIEIFGFKSFPDKTVLEFPDGITAIVGANGCGKSNISDAIRWVLGEQSAKSLRGDAMGDLIFAGTSTRKPLNFAEVILTFDNTHGLFPIAFTEVSIGRRLYRDGQSNYLLNKQDCRLRDVYDLLMDSGIGRRAHAIIEQGKISEIVTAKPEERRGIIEEAAGIAKYRSRRAEALRRLESTRDGMRRIDDIIGEMERQEGSLRRAAKKAERFREVETELRLLELSHSAARRNELRTALVVLSDRKRGLIDSMTALDVTIAELGTRIEGDKLAEEEARGRQKECATALSEAEKAVSAAESQLAELRERQADDERSLGRIGAEIDHLTSKIQEGRDTCESARESAQSLLEASSSLATARADARVEADQQVARVSDSRRALEDMTRRRAALAETLARLESETRYVEQTLLSLQNRRVTHEASLARLREEQERIAQQVGLHENELAALGIEKDCCIAEETMIRERIETADAELSSVSDEISLNEREFAVAASRHAAAVSRASEMGEMLAAASLEGIHVRALSETISFRSEHLVAFASAFADAIHGVMIVPSGSESEAVRHDIQRVAERLRGRTIYSPVFASCEAWTPRSGLSPLRDLLPEGVASTVRASLAGWYFAETSEDAAANAPRLSEWERIVTLDGDVIFPFGAVRKFRAEAADENVVGREALEKIMEAQQRDISELHSLVANLRKDRSAALADLDSLRGRMRILEGRRVELSAVISGMRERLADDGEKRLEAELKKLSDEDVSSRQRREIIDEETRVSMASTTELDRGREEFAENVRMEEASLDQLRDRASALEIEESRSRERHAAKEAEIRQLSVWLDQSSESLARYADMREEILQRRSRLTGVASDLETRVTELAVRLDACSRAYAVAETEVHDAAVRISTLDLEERAAQKKKSSFVTASHELDMEQLRVTGEETLVLERIREKYHVDLSDEACVVEPNTAPEASARIDELREMIDRMSGVNFAAKEELDELMTRLATYRAQREDLTRAEAGLSEVVSDIDKRTIALFNETFRAVNNNFGLLFNRLFGAREGLPGSAELVLLDPAHPLESGIDIIAMPPGKKPQTISLLSGGEMALTAVSLLFAVFLVRPSPFAVLDELDAPLDEANVGKYVQLLREFSQRSQFIIITHNKRTMEVADTLYGVTQMEKGISRILGMKMEDTAEVIPEAAG